MSASPWEPFTAPNMLDAPRRGQGEPNPAALLIGRLAYRGIRLSADGVRIIAEPADSLTPADNREITEHALELLRILNPNLKPDRASLDEQAEAEAALALDFIGREPSAKEVKQAQADARALLSWLRKNWHGTMTEPSFFDELEAELYRVGILSTFWGLRADRDTLRALLAELRRIEDRAGPDFLRALNEAQRREAEEWRTLAITAKAIATKAEILKSPRLEKAAELMAAMLSPDKLRPEAAAQAAFKEAGSKGGKQRRAVSNAARKELKRRYIEGKGRKWRTPQDAARALKDDALDMDAITSAERALQTLGDWFRDADRGNMG